MKRILAALVCLMLLCCGTALSERQGRTVVVRGEFSLTALIPEGYTFIPTRVGSTSAYGIMESEDPEKPDIMLSLAFDEQYDNMRMNDLSEEEIQKLIEAGTRDMGNPSCSIEETDHGTRLVVIREETEADSLCNIISLYRGYFIEMVMIAQEGYRISDGQIEQARQFLSDLWIVPDDSVVQEGEETIVILDEYHGPDSADPWVTQ